MRVIFFAAVFCFVCCHSSFAKIKREEYQRALDFLNQAQYNDAIAVLKESLDEDPDQAPIYNLIGLVYLKQNESIQSAIGSFEQAIRIDPNLADAYFNLASTYAGSADRPELAAEYFKKTLEVDPKYVKAYFGLGWFTLTALEQPEKAAEYFKKAVGYFPDFAEAYYGLGLSYIQMGKAPLALQSISQLRALNREDLAAYLESVLRGGKASDSARAEAQNEPAVPNVPQPSPSGVPVPVSQQVPAQTSASEAPQQSTGIFSSTESFSPGTSSPSDSSENTNPFKLN